MTTEPSTTREETVRSIHENASLNAGYITMNALAAVIACYGLLQDSIAVVIGAMVVAMLLGPITGIALSLINGDLSLLRKAMVAEVAGIALVLAISIVIGLIHRNMPLTGQILSRTNPNVLDLMIALAGGAAGAYATASPRISVGLVGVAIATALVPPLATAGICLARGEVRLALGGFLLFITNFVAIQIASSMVLIFNGFHNTAEERPDQRRILLQNAVSFVLLWALAVGLSYNFLQSMADQRYKNETRERLAKALSAYPGSRIEELRFQDKDANILVTAVLRAPYSFTPQRVAELESTLATFRGKQPRLVVRSIITKETTRWGYLRQPEVPDEQVKTEPEW